MNNLIEQIQKSRPELAKSSLLSYYNQLKKLHKEVVSKKYDIDGYEFLNSHFQDILNYLEQKKSLTRRNVLNAVIVAYKTLPDDEQDTKVLDKYISIRDQGNAEYAEWAEKNEKSDSQEKNWITIKEIEIIRDTFNNKKEFAKYVFLQLFLEYPTRNDYRSLKIITHRQLKTLEKMEKSRDENAPPLAKQNYFVKYATNYYIILNQFKTSRKYLPIKILIKSEFNKMLRRYLYMIKGQTYLFTNPSTGVAYTTIEFTKWIQSMFESTGKLISSTLLRHVIVSHKFGDYVKDSSETARVMGHSTAQQKMYVKY